MLSAEVPTLLKKFNDIYPHAFLKQRRGYCYRLHPSICPLCYLPLNHWTKSNQIWCESYSHEWTQTFNLLNLKAPRKNASENVVRWSRLLQIIA